MLLFFLLVSSLLIIALAANYHPQNCEAKSCGNLTDITYPFWLRDQQPDCCRFPAFELHCHDERTASIQVAQERYLVLNISYESQTILARPSIAGREGCFVPNNNLSLSLLPFYVSSVNRELIIAHNCTVLPFGYNNITCDSHNKTLALLGGAYGTPDDDGVFGSCHTVVRPVLSFPGAKVEEYMKSGFLLDWSAPNCSECRASHGQCVYNNDTRKFICICADRFYSRSCSTIHRKKVLIISLSTAGGLSLAILCSFFYLLHICMKKKHSCSSILKRIASFQPSFKSDSEHGFSLHSPIFTYEELYEATNGFDPTKELGDGSFGTVYKGKLQDGRVVAVKRLYENKYRHLKHFMNEVKILSHLQHQNLVSLYGCTSRRSRELLLVYEFVPNGTVANHLHGRHASESFLSWEVRLNIAIETADALNYLHSIEPPIIHRDIKTSNILLDESFHIKLADFGLSRSFPTNATHVSTAPQGTPGYIDPEYYQCCQLTDKSDVYSFGVVLMELISSKPAVDITQQRHEITLANMAINKIQRQELHELVDPRLGYQSDYSINRMISQVAELAFQCLQSDGELRPSIKDVVEVLRGIESGGYKDKFCEKADTSLEEARLLKSPAPPYSPNSVTEGWMSRVTTPNTSV